MPAVVTARDVCERALRKIGSYSIYDTAARPEHIDEALYWLSMVVDHACAMQRTTMFIPDTLTIELESGTQEYDLADAVGPDVPDTGIQFPVSCTFQPSAGDTREIKILRRIEWERRENRDDTGEPERIYIDRQATPKLYVDPIPDDAYVLHLVAQRFAPDYAANNAAGVEWRRAWNLWAVTATAAELAEGPITRLPDGEVALMRQRATDLWDQLCAYDLHEQANEPRQTAFTYPF